MAALYLPDVAGGVAGAGQDEVLGGMEGDTSQCHIVLEVANPINANTSPIKNWLTY